MSDPYTLHRIALAPFQRDAGADEIQRTLVQVQQIGEDRFLRFLASNDLAGLWSDALKGLAGSDVCSTAFLEKLRLSRMASAVSYLLQRRALGRIDEILDAAAVPYAVFKGAHVRELLYDDPADRPCVDIDVLVRKDQCRAAIKALVSGGFEFHPVAENISHEATLTDCKVSIDLHWDILRPGRTRIDLTEGMVKRRTRGDGYWALDDSDCLTVALIHPVFSKYLTTPAARLILLVDLHRWIETRAVDWDRTISGLRQAGVQTSAWSGLYWLQYMIPTRMPGSIQKRLSPGAIRRRYLESWINRNYPTRLLGNPMLVKTGFTLFAHDSALDALRFVRSLSRASRQADALMKELGEIVE